MCVLMKRYPRPLCGPAPGFLEARRQVCNDRLPRGIRARATLCAPSARCQPAEASVFPLSHMLKSFVRVGTLKVIDADGAEHVFAGAADGPQRDHAAQRPLAVYQAVLQSGVARGRGLHGRPPDLRELDAARLPRPVLRQPGRARHLPPAEGAAPHLARRGAPSSRPIRSARRARTSPITTTSATTSTRCSSTRACSTPAPTSSTTARAWKPPSRTSCA